MQNLKTSDFDFELPLASIAQQAMEPRDHAQLLKIEGSTFSDHHIYDLPDLLRSGDLLVMNDTRVIPARLYGKRGDVKVELLLHKKMPAQTDGLTPWLAFARPGKRLRVHDILSFAPDFFATVLEKRESGDILIAFNIKDDELLPLLHLYGEAPLPPYIKRPEGAQKSDNSRYQTIYAAHDGAVAAPTAGLHFTPQLFKKLVAKGIDHVMVTLHVGAGTFLPVKEVYIKDHMMHAEWGEISAFSAQKINQARFDGRRIIAVGTTSLRLIESAADDNGMVRPFSEETAIFITPGYRFRATDGLITNFHLPQSTLFMLVSAFMGLDLMRRAYKHAVETNYRFYSYGDANLLIRGRD